MLPIMRVADMAHGLSTTNKNQKEPTLKPSPGENPSPVTKTFTFQSSKTNRILSGTILPNKSHGQNGKCAGSHRNVSYVIQRK